MFFLCSRGPRRAKIRIEMVDDTSTWNVVCTEMYVCRSGSVYVYMYGFIHILRTDTLVYQFVCVMIGRDGFGDVDRMGL